MKADKTSTLRLLKTARGQIDGIVKMVEEDQYCIDIVNQLMASNAILRKAMKQIMHAHLSGCVMEAFSDDRSTQEEKIEEIIQIFDKMNQ